MNTITDINQALILINELNDKNLLLKQSINSLEQNINLYEQKIQSLEKNNESLEKSNELLEKEKISLIDENIELRNQVKLLNYLRFAIKSEKKRKLPQDDRQYWLFDEAEFARHRHINEEEERETPPPAPTVSKPHKKRGRRPLPPELPRVDRIIDITEEEKICACGARLVKIGEEVSEKLNFTPAKFEIIRTTRFKYACPQCEGTEDDRPTVRIAPMPPQLIKHGIVTPSLLAFILIQKFADALPLYRQSNIFARLGVDISRSTMSNWILEAAAACLPLRERLYQHLRSGPTLNLDETPVQVLREKDRNNTTKSFMWVARGGQPGQPVVLFTYSPTRSGKEAAQIIGNFNGFLQTDGYKGYEAVGARDGIIHVGCLVHVRRKFVEASKAGDKKLTGTAATIVDIIANIYHAEKLFRKQQLSAEQLLEAREKTIRPLLDAIEEHMRAAQSKVPPSSLLGKAVAYGLNQWAYVLNYLKCPYLAPDNNVAENAIRPFVVGRKNWLFSGSPRGAEASAFFYSLIESAKANGLDPQKYLWQTLEKIPSATTDEDYEALMPWKQ